MLKSAGFHYYRTELDAMPDPKEAHARRGAHWTFNAQAFVTAIQDLKSNGGRSAAHSQNDSGKEMSVSVTGEMSIPVIYLQSAFSQQIMRRSPKNLSMISPKILPYAYPSRKIQSTRWNCSDMAWQILASADVIPQHNTCSL